MRAAVILLTMLVAGEGAVAWGKGWRASSVVVRDHTSPFWRPHVEAVVARYNAMMPRNVPRLIYEPRKTRPCDILKPRKGRGVITMCARESLGHAAVTGNRFTGKHLKRSKIIVRDDPLPPDPARVICHELMHALTDIDDAPNTREDSCVLGVLAEPGAFDVAYAQRLYHKGHRR